MDTPSDCLAKFKANQQMFGINHLSRNYTRKFVKMMPLFNYYVATLIWNLASYKGSKRVAIKSKETSRQLTIAT